LFTLFLIVPDALNGHVIERHSLGGVVQIVRRLAA
jgi:hypothetical protein